MPATDHIDLVVGSLERSLPFYEGLLRPLGWKWTRQVRGERGETIHYLWGTGGRLDSSYDRYGVGLHHLAFPARSRRQVDERAAWLSEVAANIESGPEEHEYTPGYYAVFFLDPDGMKLELVHRPTVRTMFWAFNPKTNPKKSGRLSP
jgi:glyoxylase I family protein